jgi:hypothetical protein
VTWSRFGSLRSPFFVRLSSLAVLRSSTNHSTRRGVHGYQAESEVTLDIKAVSGSYDGAVNADGTELTGTLTQGSVTLPLVLRNR